MVDLFGSKIKTAMKKNNCPTSLVLVGLLMALSAVAVSAQGSNEAVKVVKDPVKSIVHIIIDGKLFTDFVYADSLEKPFLYPIYAADGEAITRGFPWNPQPNDPTDHPHHIGLWFNYEKVNGLDFWNNSFAIPAEKKNQYGWIRTTQIETMESGNQGKLVYLADWTDQSKQVLLQEKTTLIFNAGTNARVIDRITELTAVQNVTFPDAKDGMLGLRVAHELELPVSVTKEYKDEKGNITKVNATKDASATGNYLTSFGKEGNEAWGTRGNWCMLYGRLKNDVISIAMIDHPQNPGFPTYWHARNYGLFAANPLGQKVFSDGKLVINFRLLKGKSATFRYRVVITSGKEILPVNAIESFYRDFSEKNK